MLSKKFRLPIQEFFNKKSIKAAKNGIFLVKIFSSPLKFNRFGIVIGKKAAKKSTARNKIKRIIFAFFEKLIKNESGADFVVIVGSGTDKLTKEEINLQLKEVFKKIGYG